MRAATETTEPALPSPDLLAERLLPWFDAHHRTELPWRRPGTTAWGVLVSEIMSQQTQVARVAPVWEAWMARWPEPADLAAAPTADVLRAWDRMGYPRRALRLQECARIVAEEHGGTVPSDPAELEKLPGIGNYTAAAVAVFHYGGRHAVVDTNVRRVVARLGGRPDAGTATSKADLAAAASLLPEDAPTAARVSLALMELGALMCTARRTECGACPVSDACGFSGKEIPAGPSRKRQRYQGTNRHVRGEIMKLLRDADGPVERARVDAVWTDPRMVGEAVAQLIEDGLIGTDETGRFELPSR
ncbi:A/G-specific adenine glycosylase [Glycomyces endophyticus]|uniref:A/G-specific adenine glycosylase n=1 Tax=Glycomyces endophyticus TaxID=480996 RepID=A0ABP4TDB6_9ACTN